MTDRFAHRCTRAPDGLYIDTRALVPPEPMVVILTQLAVPGQSGPVFVRLDREPIYLFAELSERGWDCKIMATDPGDFRLKLTLKP